MKESLFEQKLTALKTRFDQKELLGLACIVFGVLVLIALALANNQETRTHTICDAVTKNCQIDN